MGVEIISPDQSLVFTELVLMLSCFRGTRPLSHYVCIHGEHIVLLIKGLLTAVCEMGKKNQMHFQMASMFVIPSADT